MWFCELKDESRGPGKQRQRTANPEQISTQALGPSWSHFKFHSSSPSCLHSKEPVVFRALILGLGPGRRGQGKYWHWLLKLSLLAVLRPGARGGSAWPRPQACIFLEYLTENCLGGGYGTFSFMKGRTNKQERKLPPPAHVLWRLPGSSFPPG